MKDKISKLIYEILIFGFIIVAWFGLMPTEIFAVESTFVVMGFWLISLIGSVYCGRRIVKAIKKLKEIQNETTD
jgi:hypothetical protein